MLGREEWRAFSPVGVTFQQLTPNGLSSSTSKGTMGGGGGGVVGAGTDGRTRALGFESNTRSSSFTTSSIRTRFAAMLVPGLQGRPRMTRKFAAQR